MKIFLALLALVFFHSAANADDHVVSESDQRAVIAKIVDHLRQDYVDPEVGAAAADALEADLQSGRFAEVLEGQAFAEAVSARLQGLTGDGHLNIEFSVKALELNAPAEESFGAAEMERFYGAHLNFGVETVGRLEGNVGYLDLRVFAPIEMGAETVIAAMNVVAHTDALVIDLRENGGGIGDMADLVASYLFDGERRPLTGVYDRPTDTLTQRYTQPHVPGLRYGEGKPAYVLISKKTFSAAEALAYNLQALKRVTVVGEVSGGGAHPFEYLPIHPHFVLWSVTAKSVNPITGSNWQGVGVKPDIEVPADRALEAALEHLAAQKSAHGAAN